METTNNNSTKPLITADSLAYSSSDTRLQSKYAEGIIPGILYELYEQGLTDDQGGGGTLKNHTYINNKGGTSTYSLFSLKLPPEVVNKMTDPDVIAQNATSIFVRFGDFIEMLNNFVLYNNNGGTVTSVDIKGMKCLAHPFQFSTNPTVCVISANGWIDANQQIKKDINEIKDEPTKQATGSAAPPHVGNKTKLNQLIAEIPDSSDSTPTFLSLVEDELKNGAQYIDLAIERVWRHIADLNPTPVNEDGKISYKFDAGSMPIGIYSIPVDYKYTSPDGKSVKLNKFLNLTDGSIDTMANIIYNNVSALASTGTCKYPNLLKTIFPSINGSNASAYTDKESSTRGQIKNVLKKLIIDKTYSFNEATTSQFTDVAIQEIGQSLSNVVSNLSSSSFFDPNDKNYRTGQIENIYINLDYIYKQVKPKTTNIDDKNKKNEISFNQLMHNLLLEVQNSIGSINQFEIYGDGIETGKTQIIDRNYINPVKYTDLFSFELDNTSSTAKNYSIRSQIFPEQSSIVAISTQAQSGKLGYDNKGLVNYNYGIADRIVGEADSGAELGNTTKAEQKKTHINQALSQIATAVIKLYIIPAAGAAPAGTPPI
jgi:hypothetical protein